MNTELQNIIIGCQNNDRKCQERLYRMFFDTMERVVRRYTSDEDAQLSIINNGFLKVFKNIGKFEDKGSFEGWVRRIMIHSVSDYFRKHKKYIDNNVLMDDRAPDVMIHPSTNLYYDDLLSLVKKLPEKHRSIFNLYAIEGYNFKEISSRLSINESTCRWYLSEARRKLKLMLEKMNITDVQTRYESR